jgi:hypothetical protein
VALAWWLVEWRMGRLWWERALYFGAAVVAAAYFASAVRDDWMWTTSLVWEPLAIAPSVVLLAVAGVLAIIPRWRAAAPRLAAALLVLFVGWAVGVDWAQAHADYSTSYYYGTRGQREAAAGLDALGYDGPWVGPKEVAWYARNKRYIDADTFWWLVLAQHLRFEGTVIGHDVQVVVPWSMDPDVQTFFWDQLHTRYDQVAEVADYEIWVRRDESDLVARVPDH